MTEGRQREMWNHTSSLLSVLVNVNRDPKRGRAVKPNELHPFARRDQVIAHVGIDMLKKVFVE